MNFSSQIFLTVLFSILQSCSDKALFLVDSDEEAPRRMLGAKNLTCISELIVQDQFGKVYKNDGILVSITNEYGNDQLVLKEVCADSKNPPVSIEVILYVYKQTGSKYSGPGGNTEINYEYPYTSDSLDLKRLRNPLSLLSRFKKKNCLKADKCAQVLSGLHATMGLMPYNILQVENINELHRFCFVLESDFDWISVERRQLSENILDANSSIIHSCIRPIISD